MAKVEVRVSDLSGSIISDDAELQQITVEHPDFQNPLQLDVAVADLQGRLPQPQDIVTLTINDRRYLLSLQEFTDLFTGDEAAEDVLARVDKEQHPRQRRGRQQRRPKVDYASIEHAGEPHRGRITDTEKQMVRENLDLVNDRLSRDGIRTIDPSDPEMAERYGLMQEPIEEAEVVEETPER